MATPITRYAILVGTAAAGVGGYNWVNSSYFDPTITAYWVQAIGSIAAIIGAFLLGERQSKNSMRMILEADRLAAYRRGKSILAVTDAAQSHTFNAMKAFEGNRFHYFMFSNTYSQETMKSLIDALAAIPVHELGSYRAVDALLRIRNAMNFFQQHASRCITDAKCKQKTITGAMDVWHDCAAVSIRLCESDIAKFNTVLKEEVALTKVE